MLLSTKLLTTISSPINCSFLPQISFFINVRWQNQTWNTNFYPSLSLLSFLSDNKSLSYVRQSFTHLFQNFWILKYYWLTSMSEMADHVHSRFSFEPFKNKGSWLSKTYGLFWFRGTGVVIGYIKQELTIVWFKVTRISFVHRARISVAHRATILHLCSSSINCFDML